MTGDRRQAAVAWTAGAVPMGIATLVAVGPAGAVDAAIERARAQGAAAVLVVGDLSVLVHDSVVDAVLAATEVGRAAVHVAELDADGLLGAVAEAELLALWDASAAGVSVSDLVHALAGRPASLAFAEAGTVEGPERAVKRWTARRSSTGVTVPFPPMLVGLERPHFVGRQAELAALDAAWAAARSGQRRLVALRGEPGVGKSTLAARWARRVHAEGAVVVHGWTDEGLVGPYQAIIHALDPAVGAGLPAGPAAAELARLLPAVAAQVAPTPAAVGDPDSERFRMFEAVTDLLDAAAAKAPIVVVLDDLHWADRATVLLVRHVLLRPEPARLLVVATYRSAEARPPSDLADVTAELDRAGIGEVVDVGGLVEAEVASLLVAMGETELDAASRRFSQALWRVSGGNPLFVRELMRDLVARGALVQRDGRWTSDLDIDDLAVPASLREVVGRRIDGLEPAAVDVLTALAIHGADADHALLGRVTGNPADTLAAIDQVLAAGLVLPRPGERVALANAVLRHVLRGRISDERSAQLHAAVAAALASTEGDPAAIALHHAEAGPDHAAETLRWAELAAASAADLLAFDEAAASLRLALRALDGLPDDPARRADLLLALADQQQWAGDPAAARASADDAMAVARAAGDGERLARAALAVATEAIGFGAVSTVDGGRRAAVAEALDVLDPADSELRCRLLAIQAGLHLYAGGQERSAAAEAAVAMAKRLGSSRLRASAMQALVSGAGPTMPMQEQLAMVAEIDAIARVSGDANSLFSALWLHRTRLVMTGDLAGADRANDETEVLADRLHNPYYRVRVVMHRAMRAMVDGRLVEAETLRDEGAALAEHLGAEWHLVAWAAQVAMGAFLRGELGLLEPVLAEAEERYPVIPSFPIARTYALAAIGDHAAATERLAAHAADGWAGLPRNDEWMLSVWMLALIVDELGDADMAAELHAELLPHRDLLVADSGAWVCAGSAEWPLGVLAATAGLDAAAEEHFTAAVARNAELGARSFEAFALADHAAWLARRGETSRAELLDGRAKAMAAELGLGLR